MNEALGWIGAGMFSLCAIPQSWQSYKQGHGRGLSWAFLLMWLFGEILTICYVWPKQDMPLLVNYFLNLTCLAVILKYKIWERHTG